MDAAVIGHATAHDETVRFEPVDCSNQSHGRHLEDTGEPGLRDAFISPKPTQYLPLRSREANLLGSVPEPEAHQPCHIGNQVSNMLIGIFELHGWLME